jgi:membrane protein
MWITNMAILLGAQFNAETERAGQLHAGVPGAKRELRLPEREPADPQITS